MTEEINKIVESTIEKFCVEYFRNPYLERTENGIHALFFYKLLNEFNAYKLPTYGTFKNDKVCLIQKEYRMPSACGKVRSAQWDICILKNPLVSLNTIDPKSLKYPYDYLEVDCIIEFGLSEKESHMDDDYQRLSHPDCISGGKFIVQLDRYSNNYCERDFTTYSQQHFVSAVTMSDYSKKGIYIYHVRTDRTHKGKQWINKFIDGNVIDITPHVAQFV